MKCFLEIHQRVGPPIYINIDHIIDIIPIKESDKFISRIRCTGTMSCLHQVRMEPKALMEKVRIALCSDLNASCIITIVAKEDHTQETD